MPLLAGYMVPHPPIAVAEIGRGEEKKIQATLDAFDAVAADIAALKPDTIIVISPHSVMYRDYFHISPGKKALGNLGRFRAPQVQFEQEYDTKLVATIEDLCDRQRFPAGTMGEVDKFLDHGTMVPLYFVNKRYKGYKLVGEVDKFLDHGTMVPLYFVNKRYKGYKLVRIGLSALPLELHWQFGQIIRNAIDRRGERVVFIGSGDLAHCQKEDGPYGYRPSGPEYDERIMDVMGRADFKALLDFDERFLDDCMECGHRSFTIMGGAFADDKVNVKKLSHEATFGVGYGICIYHPM